MSDSKGEPQGTRSASFMASILAIGSWIFDEETREQAREPDEKPPGPEVKGGGKT